MAPAQHGWNRPHGTSQSHRQAGVSHCSNSRGCLSLWSARQTPLWTAQGGLRPQKKGLLPEKRPLSEKKLAFPSSALPLTLPATGCLLPSLILPCPHHLPAAPECMCKVPGCLLASIAPALYHGRSGVPLEELAFLGCLEGEGEAPVEGSTNSTPPPHSYCMGPTPLTHGPQTQYKSW